MFKKISFFLVLTLVIGALSACSPYPKADAVTKQKISEACAKQGIGPVNWDAKDMTSGSVRYYGNFEGYEVFQLFPEELTGARRSVGFGPYYEGIPEFRMWYVKCELYAYKDGKIMTVEELYDDGAFGEDFVKEFKKRFEKFYNPPAYGMSRLQ